MPDFHVIDADHRGHDAPQSLGDGQGYLPYLIRGPKLNFRQYKMLPAQTDPPNSRRQDAMRQSTPDISHRLMRSADMRQQGGDRVGIGFGVPAQRIDSFGGKHRIKAGKSLGGHVLMRIQRQRAIKQHAGLGDIPAA
ncbi:hypothetical protein [Niveispirillum sp.]|uniref:hypothetical protein n=1 Tax=Niveispirillum sp. TaxID=1917217 RepID=UPI001B4540DE|nr:hypothetical protein [Niveispirillum sp.]MBP7334717.1 hypothetical protein [Niveispirillum sp.]